MMVGSGPGYGGYPSAPPEPDLLPRFRRHSSASSLLDAIEQRTQKTYRYGISLVCIGATLNWLGFAQGSGYIDPLRYLGVASVISGSFCVCLAMCRWLGRPLSVSNHLEEDSLSRSSSEVHVINVAVPTLLSPAVTKPPAYDIVAKGEDPPGYEEAIKLTLDPGYFMVPLPHHPFSTSPHSPSHSCPLIRESKDVSADSSPSPPPPYHLSPSVSNNLLDTTNSCLSSSSLSLPQLTEEREHLLSLVMQSQSHADQASQEEDQEEEERNRSRGESVSSDTNNDQHGASFLE